MLQGTYRLRTILFTTFKCISDLCYRRFPASFGAKVRRSGATPPINQSCVETPHAPSAKARAESRSLATDSFEQDSA
jgi:hypothetical protein